MFLSPSSPRDRRLIAGNAHGVTTENISEEFQGNGEKNPKIFVGWIANEKATRQLGGLFFKGE